MKKTSFFAMLVLLFFVFMSCENNLFDPVSNMDDLTVNTRSAKTKMVPTVPFKGTYKTFPVLLETDKNGTLTFKIPSEGKATHLGKSTWYSLSTVSNTEVDPSPWDQTGSSIFTAADGSQLKGHFVGTTGPTEDYPFVGQGTYFITEGTGRFKGATGQGSYSYFVNPEDFVGLLTFEGTLTQP